MAAPKGTRPPAAGMGRIKGSKNKVPSDLRAMVLRALDGAGGEEYLIAQATANPPAFMSLVGKCLPRDVQVTAKLSLGDLVREARERLKARDAAQQLPAPMH